jgi:hypothetical protein
MLEVPLEEIITGSVSISDVSSFTGVGLGCVAILDGRHSLRLVITLCPIIMFLLLKSPVMPAASIS